MQPDTSLMRGARGRPKWVGGNVVELEVELWKGMCIELGGKVDLACKSLVVERQSKQR